MHRQRAIREEENMRSFTKSIMSFIRLTPLFEELSLLFQPILIFLIYIIFLVI